MFDKKISLCMIVKNEEISLPKCLDSVRSYVDEIVIVDTGSNDRTIEAAKEFTSLVYHFPWGNDFSAARNNSISKAANDWILVLDADEIVTDYNQDSINRFITNDTYCIGRLKRINPFEDNFGVKKYIERVNRLFNRNNFCYQGIIHEQIVAKKDFPYKTKNVEIVLDHIGYTKEVVQKTNKLSRNISLLNAAIINDVADPYLHYQLGKSYYMAKEYNLAADSFERAVNLKINLKYEYIQDLLETYGYSLINSGKYEQALFLELYSSIYKKSPDYNFLMGLIYMNNAMFQQATDSFKMCIGSVEGKIQGINSYLPNYNIGVIYECLGYMAEAKKYYKKCGAYTPALQRLLNIKIN
ncbi:glycosyltransferase family 2 protein [Desulforamulus aquiferis]|uniref:Glycosyltransferase n=1 Tax=Desulforamulus aquiferis TaxID=1397668 RepID=A0AAW7ZGN0_9FIRM|nr:glycosyltransferase family 2 protein [Desulforamulus aquiferis]MDO7788354.1 glycosyltransferase [Desulforamulus aquiferis]RYD06314.1 hypothetical protein N752_05320 [Desulforamulus aquiferis]